MAYPPPSRRTKMRHRATLAAALAAIGLTTAGFTMFGDERFEARSAPLAGTPVTLRVEHGVAPSEVTPVRIGILASERYTRRLLGRPVRGPVDARVSGGSGCRLLSHT